MLELSGGYDGFNAGVEGTSITWSGHKWSHLDVVGQRSGWDQGINHLNEVGPHLDRIGQHLDEVGKQMGTSGVIELGKDVWAWKCDAMTNDYWSMTK